MVRLRYVRLVRAAGAAALLVALAAGALASVPATVDTFFASDIAAVYVEGERSEGDPVARVSSLLVADGRSGTVYYYRSDSAPSARVAPADLKPYFDLGSPRAIAHSAWGGCVWDAKPGQLICFDILNGDRWTVWTGRPFVAPSRIAVSPDGVIAVVDPEAGGLFWLAPPELPGSKSAYGAARPSEPFQVAELADLRPSAVAFVNWDTLAVLDQATDSIVTLRFAFDGRQLLIRDRRSLPFSVRSRLGELRAIAAQDGVLYVADATRLYVYLESEGLLVPALPGDVAHSDIRQIAASYHDIYLLDGGHVDRALRTVPVDLTLEGSPDVSQSALIALYSYLEPRGLLERREILVRTDFASLEALLVAERVLVVPPGSYRAAALPRAELRGRTAEMATWPASERRLAELERLLCRLNPALCAEGGAASLARPVPAGTRLTLPALALESRLRRREVALDGRSPEWHLERMVFSPEQRAKADPELLRRLNPQFEAAMKAGRMVLPVESWFATVAVAAADLESPESAIRELAARHRGVGLYARAAYSRQLAKSLQDPPQPVDGDLCAELRAERHRWLRAIRYPFGHDPALGEKLLFPRIETARVSIGVLESQSQLRTRHQVFDLDPENPAWYEPLDFELVAPSVPVSAEDIGEQVVEDRATYSRDLHHGTHVAALLGGRSGRCWSGLLPRSKLVLVDVTTPGGLRDRVLSAMAAGTRAFNVSQELTRSQSSDFERDSIKRLITVEAASAVFVVAAGNDGKDLNTVASIQLPAGLGQAANVVTVTAVTAAQSVLGPFVGTANQPSPGANRGKLFVDLAAPGEAIVSASADRRYGPATGTSQAAPAVAAAAAFLADEFEGARQAPGEVKARLIATADWNPGLEGQVWGGLFNFGDAVRFPDRNLLQTANGGESRLYSITPRGNARLKVTNQPRYYERDRVAGLGRIVEHDELRMQWVLSIKSRGDGTHRVVFRDPLDRRLYILLDAVLEGSIECSAFELLDEPTLAFQSRPQDCAPSISIAQVNEYVAALPYHVEW